MGRSRRLATHVVLTMLVGGVTRGSMAKNLDTQDHDEPMVIVRIDQEVVIAADLVQFAEERAAEVFSRIGVRVKWIDADTAAREHLSAEFALVLVNAEHNPGVRGRIQEALGYADPRVSRAHVFYDRIDALRVASPASIASILGDVMAHELGHLMLPPPGHSLSGIMRPEMNLKIRAVETFNKSQALLIVSRLRSVP